MKKHIDVLFIIIYAAASKKELKAKEVGPKEFGRMSGQVAPEIRAALDAAAAAGLPQVWETTPAKSRALRVSARVGWSTATH